MQFEVDTNAGTLNGTLNGTLTYFIKRYGCLLRKRQEDIRCLTIGDTLTLIDDINIRRVK